MHFWISANKPCPIIFDGILVDGKGKNLFTMLKIYI